jgi:tetratricopeptide (TPR) repeat protein
VLLNLGENAQAEAVYAEAIAAERRNSGGDGVVVAQYLGDLATLQQVSGRRAEAEAAFREGLQALREHSEGAAQGELAAMLLHHLADVLRERKALPEARLLAEEGYALFRRNPGWPRAERQHAGFVLKEILVAQGDLEAAAVVCRQRLEDLQADGQPDSPERAGLLSEFTLVLLADQKFPEAEAVARQSLMIREKQIPDDWRTFNSRSLLGGALLGLKRFAEAEPLLRSGYEGMKKRETKIPPQGKPRLREALQRLVQLSEETGRPEQAQAWKQELSGLDQP